MCVRVSGAVMEIHGTSDKFSQIQCHNKHQAAPVCIERRTSAAQCQVRQRRGANAEGRACSRSRLASCKCCEWRGESTHELVNSHVKYLLWQTHFGVVVFVSAAMPAIKFASMESMAVHVLCSDGPRRRPETTARRRVSCWTWAYSCLLWYDKS